MLFGDVLSAVVMVNLASDMNSGRISLQCRRYVGAEYGTLDKSVRCRHLGL